MSNVTLDIAGRKYTIACAEGEEPHIEMLGASIDNKLSKLENLAGQSPERILLYASLLLADELHEAKEIRNATTSPSTDIATKLEALADRMEDMAGKLETNSA